MPVSLLVDFLKTKRILKTDLPRFGQRNEAKVANEEHSCLVNRSLVDALQFANQKGRERITKVNG